MWHLAETDIALKLKPWALRQSKDTDLLVLRLGFRREINSTASTLSVFKKLREVVQKVACAITLIFNKRRAFSLRLSSVLFGHCFFFFFLIFRSHLLSHSLPDSVSLCLSFYLSCLLFLYYICCTRHSFHHTQGGGDKRERCATYIRFWTPSWSCRSDVSSTNFFILKEDALTFFHCNSLHAVGGQKF